jgi:hypothetical protein
MLLRRRACEWTAAEEYRCCCRGACVSGQLQRNTDVAVDERV